MRIAIVAGECNHLVIHTGLASYVRDLGRALRTAGHDACVVVPHFGCVKSNKFLKPDAVPNVVPVPGGQVHTWLVGPDELPANSIEPDIARPAFQNMDYVPGRRDRLDWDSQFALDGSFADPSLAHGMIEFNRIATQWLLDAGPGWTPDVIHSVNWEAGLVPAWSRYLATGQNVAVPKLVFTVDLLTRQGIIPTGCNAGAVPKEIRDPARELNFLGRGIEMADMVHLPSQQWADELCAPKSRHAGNLGESIQIAAERDLLRIAAFAINEDTFSPHRDPQGWNGPAEAASRSLPELKAVAKSVLREELGLLDLDGPLFLAGNRLDPQKGYDAIRSTFPGFLDRHPHAQLILRTLSPPGNRENDTWKRRIFDDLLRMERWFPGRVAVNPPDGFGGRPDIKWLRLLLAADVSMMPSRFEPCGLNHRQSLCCGTPVIATRKGDMAVTITPKNGWLFDDPVDHGQFRWCLEDALATYESPKDWARKVQGAMHTSVGWNSVVPRYLEMYQSASLGKPVL